MRFCTFQVKAFGRLEMADCGMLAVWLAWRTVTIGPIEELELCRDHLGHIEIGQWQILAVVK